MWRSWARCQTGELLNTARKHLTTGPASSFGTVHIRWRFSRQGRVVTFNASAGSLAVLLVLSLSWCGSGFEFKIVKFAPKLLQSSRAGGADPAGWDSEGVGYLCIVRGVVGEQGP
jgi:hypothetical protein